MSQAYSAGVKMNPLDAAQLTVSNPIVHDETRSSKWYPLFQRGGDRSVRYPDAVDAPNPLPRQRDAPISGMGYAQSGQFIVPRSLGITDFFVTQVGDVDVTLYNQWLQQNYAFSLH